MPARNNLPVKWVLRIAVWTDYLFTCSLIALCEQQLISPSAEIFIRLKGSLSTSICVSFFEQHGPMEVCDLLCFCCFDIEISRAILTQHIATIQTSVLYVELMVALENTESSTHFTTTSKTPSSVSGKWASSHWMDDSSYAQAI